MSFFFFFYINYTLDSYQQHLQKSFFGYYPTVSLVFDKKDKQTSRAIRSISKELTKKNIQNSIVYKADIDKKFYFCDADNTIIKRVAKLIVYQDKYFQKKFSKDKDVIFTKALYESIVYDSKNYKNVFLCYKNKNISLNNSKSIDVGFTNVTQTLILEKSLFDKLDTKLHPTQIDILSNKMDDISKIVSKKLQKYIYVKKPKIKIYTKDDKLLTRVKTLFKDLSNLKMVAYTVIFMLILLLFVAFANALKELKEKELEILKKLGFKTSEIAMGFVFSEMIVTIFSFLFSILLFILYLVVIIHTPNIIDVMVENIKTFQLLLFSLLFVYFVSFIYFWRMFKNEKFD